MYTKVFKCSGTLNSQKWALKETIMTRITFTIQSYNLGKSRGRNIKISDISYWLFEILK